MTEKDLIKKLSQCKKIKPDENWVVFCRQNLVNKMTAAVEGETFKPKTISNLTWFWFSRLAFLKPILRPAMAFALLFVFVFGGGIITAAKAKNSLPGDHLYPVKIALEQIRLSINTSPVEKAKIQSEIMTTRLNELDKVLKQPAPVQEKQQKIAEAVLNLQKQIIAVKDQLPKTDNAANVIETAKNIGASASQAEAVLNQAKATLSLEKDQVLAVKIDEAGQTADEVAIEALEAMIVNQEKAAGIIPEEIASKLDDRIKATEQKILSVKDTVTEIGTSSLPTDADLILDQCQKAQDLLDKAKISLKDNDMAGALGSLKAAVAIVKSAKNLVQNIGPVNVKTGQDNQDNLKAGESDQNASSTPVEKKEN